MRVREIIPIWRIERFLERRRNRRTHLFTKEMLEHNVEAAKRHGVEAGCHPRDFIYEFVTRHPGFSIQDAANYYFDDGARSAEKFATIVNTLPIQRQPIHILEFASGYGCVTRHLKKNATFALVACDIHKQAGDFIRKIMGVRAVLSTHLPEDFTGEEKFDVVFALSFFSHMPEATFGRWMRALFSQLRCPGYLVFTTHGLASRKFYGNPEIPPEGIWFSTRSEQGDLRTSEYGSSIVTEEFVKRQVHEQTGGRIFNYQRGFWWGHQDLWIVQNE